MEADAAVEDAPTPSAGAPGSPGGGAARPRRAAYRRLSVEERRGELIRAALELFSRHAPEEVSLDDVAVAADASRPLVYRYFPGGKQQLYEEALGSAAEGLAARFVEPRDGPRTRRLGHVLERYFAFVDEHAAGYAALLRGGSVAETERTDAIVDGVRRAAHQRIIEHLTDEPAGPRLRLLVRSWVSVVETAALSWLDEGREIPVTEQVELLVDQFVAMFAAAAVHDPQCARLLRRVVADEGFSGPGARLAERLGELLAAED
jgi:AcrR family transcriptional regulator